MPLISARTARFSTVALTVCLAAGIAAGVATGTRGTTNPGLPRPNKTYSTRARHGLSAPQYIRVLAAFLLLPAGLCCLGLLLRLQYG